MSAQFISVHPDNPQNRFIKQICEILRKGGVAVLPTDSAYALCCMTEQKMPWRGLPGSVRLISIIILLCFAEIFLNCQPMRE